MFDYRWNCGLVFGVQQDEAYVMEEEKETPEEVAMISVHLGFITICYLFI